MSIDLTQKSKELKDYVGQYETKAFLGHVTSLIQFIRSDAPLSTLKGLSSPQRQLYYLAGLNVSAKIPEGYSLKTQLTDDDFEHVKNLLNEIEEGYTQFFYPKSDEEVNENWLAKRQVAMPRFLSYFNQGQLNYEEQIIERVIDHFAAFDREILAHFTLSVQDFVDIYNFIDGFANEYLMEKINKKPNQQTWEQFCEEMKEKNLMPWEWQEHLPEHYKNFFEFMDDPGLVHRYSRNKVIAKFGKAKTNKFLELFSCKREESTFLYYTENNVLHNKPIYEIGNEEFQSIEMKQIIHAIYNTLMQFCTSSQNLKERFYANRGSSLEDKIEKIFKAFFNNKCFVHKGYYTQDKHEQDLLIITDGLALIVEAKASKRDEPRRDPDKAYPLILTNFNETIQKGYDQAYRVKSKFIDRTPLNIYKDQMLKHHIVDIKTKNYHHAFSIIVTLERFGQIQTDLEEMLEIWDDDEFPWSICLDDLEVFLLQLKKMRGKTSDFVRFLKLRQGLHGKLVTADELDVCGSFLTGEIYKYPIQQKKKIGISPKHSSIFDITYQTERLGLTNEKNVELKSSGRYRPLGGY